MNQRTLLDRLWSPAGFGLVLLALLLPFLTVSCGGEQPIDSTFTGVDLIVGGGPDMAGPGVDPDVQRELTALLSPYFDADPFAILAAIAAMIAMAVGLLPSRLARHGAAAGLALLTGALLTAAVARAPGRVDDALRDFAESTGMTDQVSLQTQIRYGFWAVLALLAVLVVANLIEFGRALGRPAPLTPPGTGPPGGDPPGTGPPRAEALLPPVNTTPPGIDDEYWRRPA